MVAVQLDQNAEWAAIAPLIQAKQREIAERVEIENRQVQTKPLAATTIAPASDAGRSRLDMRDNPQTRRDETKPDADLTPRESAQFAMRVFLEFKAQGGEETKLQVSSAPAPDKDPAPNALSAEDERVLKELRARDAEVRRHEQAHAVAAGGYASAPTYVYQQGPDGRQYAIGGSVRIDTAPIPNDPEATIAKMEVIRRAALAPAEPSSADRGIAAAAQAVRAQAVADAASARAVEQSGGLDRNV